MGLSLISKFQINVPGIASFNGQKDIHKKIAQEKPKLKKKSSWKQNSLAQETLLKSQKDIK